MAKIISRIYALLRGVASWKYLRKEWIKKKKK
jgi:hypothetical protein